MSTQKYVIPDSLSVSGTKLKLITKLDLFLLNIFCFLPTLQLDDALQLSLQDVIESNNCVDFNSGLGDLSDYDTIINQRPSYTDSTSDEFFEYEKYYGTKDFYKIWIDKLISSRPNGDGTQGSGDISGIPELRQFDPDFRESFAPGPDGNTACDECSVEDGESSCCGYAREYS